MPKPPGKKPGCVILLLLLLPGMQEKRAIKDGPYKTIVHDGPEYETGTMFGANLMISDFNGLMKAIYDGMTWEWISYPPEMLSDF